LSILYPSLSSFPITTLSLFATSIKLFQSILHNLAFQILNNILQNTIMGNFKSFVHSLRSRFSPSKNKASPASDSSTATSYASPASIFDPHGSPSTLRTSPSLASDASSFTPPTTPSKSPRPAYKNEPDSDKPYEVEDVVGAVQADDTAEHSDVSPYAELAASPAMLDFARKLPLEELSMIGRCLVQPLASSTDTATVLVEPLFFNTRAQVVTPEPGSPTRTPSSGKSITPLLEREFVERLEEPHISVPISQRYSSHTLSLSEVGSDSTWSFACRSARRIEGEHELSDIDEGAVSSSVSLSVWSVGDIAEPSPLRVHQIHHALKMSDAEFDALPDYSDVEDDPDYDEPIVGDADVWSVTSAPCSDAEEVYDEDEIDMHTDHPAFMSDSALDALPNFSDVEDDPEYNVPFERNEDVWSLTSMDSEETLVMPAVYHSSAIIDDAKARVEEVAYRKRKQAVEGEDMPSKRQKLQQEILKMQAEIMCFDFEAGVDEF
jgi:hypothetical protein